MFGTVHVCAYTYKDVVSAEKVQKFLKVSSKKKTDIGSKKLFKEKFFNLTKRYSNSRQKKRRLGLLSQNPDA